MPGNGMVNLTIADNGATISLPRANLALVLDCASQGPQCMSGGPPYVAPPIIATRNPATLLSTFGYGRLVEGAGMMIRDGATVLALRLPTTTAGQILAGAAKNISSSTDANPIVVTATAHGFQTGDVVTIAGHLVNTAANGTWPVTRLTADTFSIPATGNGVGVATGAATWTGSIMTDSTGAGVTSGAAAWFTGTPLDDSYPFVAFTTGGTTATAGIYFTAALDAQRQTNLPRIALGTALTYVIPQTGLTLNVTTTLPIATGVNVRCVARAPLPSIADIVTAMACVQISTYAGAGWGVTHLLSVLAGTDAGSVGTSLETWASAAALYQRMIAPTRDNHPPSAWGGDGETDATWSASLLADYASEMPKRLGVSAGYYNMRGVFPNPVCGLPLYRRPMSWAWAARVAGQLPLRFQLEAWRRLGAMSQITEDQANDYQDGFNYHDESANPAFDNLNAGSGRMTTGTHVTKRTGWFLSTPITLAPTGSQYQLMANGRTIDDVSDIIQDAAIPDLYSRPSLNKNGTITTSAARTFEEEQTDAIDALLSDQIDGRTIVVDPDYNVRVNQKLHVTGSIQARGAILEIDETIGLV